MIVAYVSGHGFGHSTRVGEVLRAVRRQAPQQPMAVVTSAPESLYREAVPGPLLFRAVECDVGLAQRGALVIDVEATIARWREFVADWTERVETEAAWLRSIGAEIVLGDVPPLAFAAAQTAGLPSIALANFSWDWIYAHLARQHAVFAAPAEWAARAYRSADRLLRLPFYGDLSVFRAIEDVPLVARRARAPRAELRRRLGFGDDRVVLLSFGGLGLPGFDPARFARHEDYRFVMSEPIPNAPANFQVLDRSRLDAVGMGYVDLVAAVDVVVTKPGYGIVSDCIGTGTRLVYTDRGDFPEYPILVEQMARWLPVAYVTNAALAQGEIVEALESVLTRPVPAPPDLEGADRVAARLLER
jgi:L-arabinokinase